MRLKKVIFISFLISVLSDSYLIAEQNTNINSDITATHIVQQGETLSSIAKKYSLDIKTLIDINNLNDKNYIFVGQNLSISNIDKKNSNNNSISIKEFHEVAFGETLTDIATKYGISIKNLLKLNNFENPNSIEIGTKVRLRARKNNRLKLSHKKNSDKEKVFSNINFTTYGPLRISSNKVEVKNGRQTIMGLNGNGVKIILSLNCEKKEIDVRTVGRKWKGWIPAKENFEKKILKDFCS